MQECDWKVIENIQSSTISVGDFVQANSGSLSTVNFLNDVILPNTPHWRSALEELSIPVERLSLDKKVRIYILENRIREITNKIFQDRPSLP